MRNIVLALLAAATLAGCAESPTGKAYVQCVRDNPNSGAENALMMFGALGGVAAGLSANDAGSARRQCFIDHGVPL